MLTRPEVTYISVKISAIAAQLSTYDHEGSVQRVAERLRRLYRAARATSPRTFVNLDMEEYRDLALTVDVFTPVLAEEEFRDIEAGIVLQAYLPESHAVFEQLLAWARDPPRAGRCADQGPDRQGRQPRDGDRRGPDPRLDSGALRIEGRRRCLLQEAGRCRRAPGECRRRADRDRQPQPVRPRVGTRGGCRAGRQRPDRHRDAGGDGQRRGPGHHP